MDVSSLVVGSAPAACMLVCTILGLGVEVPENVAGALQHFAAGLLLSAVGCELLPVLLEAEGFHANLLVTIGFFAGMAVLIVLGVLLPEEDGHGDDDEDDKAEAAPTRAGSLRGGLGASRRGSMQRRGSIVESFGEIAAGGRGLRSKSASRRELAKSIQESRQESRRDALGALDEEKEHPHESQPLTKNESAPDAGGSLPLSFLAAVVVDAFMDGFLLGITGVAGRDAALLMAGSLSVEMSFVGLTLATACKGLPKTKSIPAALAGPLTIMVGAAVGGLVTGFVEGNPALMAGIMGFGTSALLFMVAEELLLEAHEGGKHVWWVDTQLYTGFYWGFMSSKFLPE